MIVLTTELEGSLLAPFFQLTLVSPQTVKLYLQLVLTSQFRPPTRSY